MDRGEFKRLALKSSDELKAHNKNIREKYDRNIRGSIDRFEVVKSGYVPASWKMHHPIFAFLDMSPEKAVYDYAAKGTVTVLNVADYCTPAGDYLTDGKSVEAELCSNSTLYQVLSSAKVFGAYYQRHNSEKSNSGLYFDDMLWIPGIIFDDGERVAEANVISCTPPNRDCALEEYELSKRAVDYAMQLRAHQIISTFMEHPTDTLIIGSFGCDKQLKNSIETTMRAFFNELMGRDIPAHEVVFCTEDERVGSKMKDAIKRCFGIFSGPPVTHHKKAKSESEIYQ